MPGARMNSRSSVQRKELKLVKGNIDAVSYVGSDDEVKTIHLKCRKKVRVICTDPDATESSSDEEDGSLPKRIVREIFIPVHRHLMDPVTEDGGESIYADCGRGCMLPQIAGNIPALRVKKKMKSMYRKVHSGKSSSLTAGKRLLHRKGFPHVEVGQESQANSTARIHDSATAESLRLSACDGAEAAVETYGMGPKNFAPKINRENDARSFPNSMVTSINGPSWDCYRQNSMSKSASSKALDYGLDMESLINSPSSVLDDTASDDSESLNFFMTADILGDVSPTDSCCSEEGSATGNHADSSHTFESHANMADQRTMKLECTSDGPSVEPIFYEETRESVDFGLTFGLNREFHEFGTTCLLDPKCDHIMTVEEELGELVFDLDSETLEWINVMEVQGV
ncbi:hypothetical protein KP509_23G011400 [Ceratopteris richardii]|uniref:Uncharacterized protein n=1 Tax=Ceratopteris richardii TaxID=49495 RepID=A0A8T2RZG0_CERRI|nr:hypothetical protein KP509_23G011400 [Ceratopteris richardii]